MEKVRGIKEIADKTFSYLEREAGIIVEDGCWIYLDKVSGAMVKVNRPREVFALLEGYGERMFLLDSEDVTDAGMILGVYENVVGRWSLSNYFVEVGGFDTPVVYLPKPRAHEGEDKVYFYLRLTADDDRYGGWRVMMPRGIDRQGFYRKLEAKIGLTPSILRRFALWVRIHYGNRKRGPKI